jgi:alkylation response protein AidB-like acyl-CoA dehydrogenase
MEIGYTPEQQAMQQELRAYYEKLLDPATVAELHESHAVGEAPRRIWKQMCADGWAGIGWPKEYGGQGRTPIEQFLFFDEAMYAGINVPTLTLNAVAPSIMQHATEEQKKTILPRILRGECHFAIGYTEPSAGTDLASLRTKAVRDGDTWVINGNKIYTSQAEYADYIWLAARTNPDAPKKHDGLSIFMVPTNSPGYRCTPITTMGGFRTNSTYYEDVRVPADHLIGPQDGGWWLIVTQLNHERVSLMTVGMVLKLYEDVVAWAKATRHGGGRVIDQGWVQLNLARVEAGLEVLRLVNWKQAWALTRGALNYADASVVKVFGSEFYVLAYKLLLEVLGPAGAIRDGSPDAVLRGRCERLYRGHAPILTFGGGTNEVQREIIAMAGLGMPRAR